MAGDNTMMQWMTNGTIVNNVIESLTHSIMTAYEQVRISSGAEWRLMSAQEKLARLLLRLNMVSFIITTL